MEKYSSVSHVRIVMKKHFNGVYGKILGMSGDMVYNGIDNKLLIPIRGYDAWDEREGIMYYEFDINSREFTPITTDVVPYYLRGGYDHSLFLVSDQRIFRLTKNEQN